VKIDNKLTSRLTGEVAADSRPTPRSGSSSGSDAPPAAGVDVQLSSLGSQLRNIESGLAGGDSIDAAKVAEIRQAISEGRLNINPNAIADRLLQTVQELIKAYRP
jgi:negative regulator of flagellin synthesis FlgM